MGDGQLHRVFVPVVPEPAIGYAGQQSKIDFLVITRHHDTVRGDGPGSAPTWAAGHSMPGLAAVRPVLPAAFSAPSVNTGPGRMGWRRPRGLAGAG